MKQNFFLFLTSFAFVLLSPAQQNIGVGTITPQAKLHVKGTTDMSQLIIDANNTQSNLNPLIRLRNAAGLDLLHFHSDNPNNTFVGLNTGRVNSVAGGALANTFIGALSGYSNTNGYSLTGVGKGALFSNISGGENTALGSIALYYNTSGSNNTAVGRGALYQNLYSDNTAVGFRSLFSNVGATRNTAMGSEALVSNINGNDNTAVGYRALYVNNGQQNTAIGLRANYSNVTGERNVVIGNEADANSNTNENTVIGNQAYVSGNNSVAIGNTAYVNGNNSTVLGSNAFVFGDNKMQLGNTITSVIATSGGYVITSDARFKDNVNDLATSLDFILRLRPVSYNFNYKRYDDFLRKTFANKNIDAAYEKQLLDKTSRREIGFVAQEVERICLNGNYTLNGVYKPQNDNDNYSLDCSKFVVPLVSAMQEQQLMIVQLQQQVAAGKINASTQTGNQESINEGLKKQIAEMKIEIELLKKKN